jgi:DNA-binding response OmpR family regulator
VPRILVVGDAEEAAELCFLLAVWGQEALAAAGLDAALALAADFRPDAALVGLGAPDAARLLRSAPGLAGCCLVALTQRRASGEDVLALRWGFRRCLHLPVRGDELGRLSHWLERAWPPNRR